MAFPLQPPARVRLTRAAVALYGGAWPHFVPAGQGGGAPGTLLEAQDRPHKPGAAPRPYLVQWDNGVVNSYRVEDLQPLEDTADVTAADTDGADDASNIIPFRRRP